MSTFAVIGVSGYAGGAITAEALGRGHQVVGVSRSAPGEAPEGLTINNGDIADADFVKRVAQSTDALVVAVHGVLPDGSSLADQVPQLLAAAQAAGARLGFVGGAGSLHVSADGPRLVDTPDFPEQFKPEALAHAQVLETLRTTTTPVDWFYVSPAASFGSYNPGIRTGEYRVGGDVLLSDADGKSEISGADYAVAFVDELEQPKHHKARFSVAY